MTHSENWLTATSTQKMDLDTLRHYKACSIEGIEISLPWREYETMDLPQFCQNAQEAGLTICSMHLPFSREISIATLNADHRTAAIALQHRLIAEASANGIHRFVLHPSSEPIADEDRAQCMQLSKEALAGLAECTGYIISAFWLIPRFGYVGRFASSLLGFGMAASITVIMFLVLKKKIYQKCDENAKKIA